jgi:D-alanine-D-alanine ligase
MARKLRIAILYNEPTSADTTRKFVAENGQLKEGPAPVKTVRKEKAVPAVQPAHDLSELGVLQEMEDIRDALSALGYRPSLLNVDSDVVRLIDHLRQEKPDLIFNLVECIGNESILEMNVAALYELMRIPFTGAGPMALGTALNKPRVKEILAYHGIPSPKFQVFRPTDRLVLREDMRFPLIVKPSHEDASVGIEEASVVSTVNELRKRIRYIFHEFDQSALVEEYIDGRELNVAVLGWKRPVVLPISEIDFSGLTPGMRRIVSYEAKWVTGTVAFEGTKGVCPAVLPQGVESRVKDLALRAYHLIGCRDYGRVDIRLAEDGTVYVLEVNPNPDISDDAGFARSARSAGLSFPATIGRIVESALERCQPG